MAQSTLAPTPSPEFPQDLLSRVTRLLAEAETLTCEFESPESAKGACDGVPCFRKASVYHLGRELAVCAKHFAEVERG